MKKFLAVLLAVCFVFCLAACGNKPAEDNNVVTDNQGESDVTPTGDENTNGDTQNTENADLKIGLILLGDENEGYTYAHIKGIQEAAKTLGLSDDQLVWKYSIPEDATCTETALDLVDQGCNLIISNSYGHQSFMEEAASQNPEVTFVAMTGDTAAKSGLDNFCNAFTHVFESRYVSGVVAGMKVAELIADGKLTDKNYDGENVKIGYVGAYPYAEVVSGYTAFFLGIQSIVPNVTMEVSYTNSWFDITMEAAAADALMADGCVIIGQHADSTGAPSAVQAAYEKGNVAYSIGYNVDMLSVAPDAALTSATNNWAVYYTYAFGAMLKGEKIKTDWAEGFTSDAVAITDLGKSCAEGTAEKVAEVEKQLHDGTLHVFDTSKFTVGGEHLDSYDKSYGFEGNELIKDGYFHESELRSAPAFDIRIDGIKELA